MQKLHIYFEIMKFIEITKFVKNESWSMIDLHSHSFYEIYFLVDGNRTFFFSSELYKLSAPAIVIIPPHIMHKTEGGPFERYNINVSDSYLDDFQRHTLKKNSLKIIPLNADNQKTILNLFTKICSIEKSKEFREYITKSIFSYLVLLLSELESHTHSPVACAKKDVPPVVLKIIDYLNTHYADKITLHQIANEFFISKGTLIYNFNKYICCSPIEYLLNVRLTKAKELLHNTNKSVNDISDQCGFSSPNYFGLIFKQREKVSPMNYRKNRLTKDNKRLSRS